MEKNISKLIRSNFKNMIGYEKYEKFIRHILFSNRLSYWQEKRWNEYQNKHDFVTNDFIEIKNLFLVCPLHDCKLNKDKIKIIGVEDSDPFSLKFIKELEMNSNLPFHGLYFLVHSIGHDKEKMYDGFYCSSCRNEYVEYV